MEMTSLEIAFSSHKGSQNSGEGDAFFQKDNLLILADGMGVEHLRGIAREQACRIISESFFRRLSEDQSPGNALVYALEEANSGILKEGEKLGERMVASVSVVYVRDRIMYFTHLGDSRIYSFHEKELNQLTRDHTVLEEDPFSPIKTDDPRIMRALTDGLGIHDKPAIKVKKYPLHKKGLILMTTEGLTERLSNRDIRWLSMKTNSPEKLCQGMIKLAKRKGGNGNMAVGVMRFGKISKDLRNIIIAYSAFFLILLTVAFSYFLKYSGKDPDIDGVREIGSMERIQALPEQKVEPIEKETVSLPPVIVVEEEMPAKIIQPIKIEPVKARQVKTETQQKDAELFDVIYAFVTEWKAAWEKTAGKNGDMDRYISFYSKDFRSSGLSRDGWKRDKSRKGRKKGWIRIEMSDIKISGPKEDDLVEIRFSQRYNSPIFSVRSEKRLILRKEGMGWKIISERSSS
ncbi:MAG: protein phosphatase 2C domain-containing protein [Deltaproteobacteria bacterium]|nr:protein phosphatase 2C domain-containing protein [Deltaproteobacteria bacterium]